MKKVIPKHTEYYCDICEEKITVNWDYPVRNLYYFRLARNIDKSPFPIRSFVRKECMCDNCYKKIKNIISKGGLK